MGDIGSPEIWSELFSSIMNEYVVTESLVRNGENLRCKKQCIGVLIISAIFRYFTTIPSRLDFLPDSALPKTSDEDLGVTRIQAQCSM